MTAELAHEQSREKSYLVWLLVFICFFTLFEGYDLLIINLALPYLGVDFSVDSETLGTAVGLINVGTIVAFIPVRLADRFGRRAIFLTAVSGYTLFTFLSAFSVGLYDFVAYQFCARMFMVTEISIAAIILTEEMPARYRGAAVTLMFALSLAGGILGSAVFPHVVDTQFGWRTLYILGAIAAPVLLFYWSKLRETRRFKSGSVGEDEVPLLQSSQALKIVFQKHFRRRALAGATIWFTVNAWSSSCLFFFSYYVTNERGWDTGAVSYALTWAYSLAIIGYATAGPMLDFAGRRLTATVYFSIGALAACVCFPRNRRPSLRLPMSLFLGCMQCGPLRARSPAKYFLRRSVRPRMPSSTT